MKFHIWIWSLGYVLLLVMSDKFWHLFHRKNMYDELKHFTSMLALKLNEGFSFQNLFSSSSFVHSILHGTDKKEPMHLI